MPPAGNQHNRVLVVDDNLDNLQILIEHLEDYDISVATSGEEAIKLALDFSPSLILLDVVMPGINGFETCRRLKANEYTKEIPVIFLTALSDATNKLEGFSAGGVDYITKPLQVEEVLARVNAHLSIQRQKHILEEKKHELESKIRMMKEQGRIIDMMARTDPLTNLSNRMDFLEKAGDEVARVKKTGKPFTIILTDIDHFKRVNDTFGHDCGDHVLVTVSSLMSNVLRRQDIISRWGGEEFIILLPETDEKGAETVAEKIRNKVALEEMELNGNSIKVTLTLGICQHDNEKTLNETVVKADAALYKGKESGRNRVVIFK